MGLSRGVMHLRDDQTPKKSLKCPGAKLVGSSGVRIWPGLECVSHRVALDVSEFVE